MVILTCLLQVAASPVSQPIYAVGQIWKYHTRPEDPSSLLRIAGIEAVAVNPARTIYHISVIRVHLEASSTATAINHLPVTQETLDRSVTELTNSDEIFPDVAESIKQWRAVHGGVFTVTVEQIVALAAARVGGR